ncbi:MAG: 23S rRNA (guanosine(2251)-2'-O)-methyltransferase RlmB [Clostridia bacterium]|nr:23S rRNA (guanosine(2251)-2'-O)-methyltransferase RlmB [Clostridia bacterium]
MEESPKGKKPLKKHGAEKHGDDRGRKRQAASRPSGGAAGFKKSSSYKYAGRLDLVDSFEAEERKNAASGAGHEHAQKGDRGKRDVASNKSKKYVARSRDPKRREGQVSPAAQKDGIRAEREPRGRDNTQIKTKTNREYIPFDDGNDEESVLELFSDDADYYGKSRRSETGAAGTPGAVAGRNAVRELLRSERSVDKIYVKSGSREGSIVVIVAEAVNRKIPIVEVSQDKLTQLAGGPHHQGIVALAAEKQYTDIDGILKIAKDRGETPLIVLADGIEDPQNLGTLIRCADCAGAHGIVIPKRRAVGLTPIVAKASAGAIEHMAVAKVSNLYDAVLKLKKEGIWIFAAEAGGVPYYEADLSVPAAIVLGSEGFGVSRVIKEHSDAIISIPMYGKVNSLNVSAAASVLLCHAARMQRTAK